MSQPPHRSGEDHGPEIVVEPLRYQPGELLGEKVRLVSLLGQGGMGTVWRAHHLTLDVEVAVKLLHGDLISPETSEQLQREAHAAALLQHSSAVRVYDFGRTELGDCYIVMELLVGESLADVLARRHHLPATEALALLLPVVGAVAAAHARGIVHRDLKPENVVLVETSDGFLVPKVVDFGIAKVTAPGRDSIADGDALLGSPAYMAPEHVVGDAVDARSDVFSLGVVLYEMLCGETPFTGAEPIDVLRAICQDEPTPLDRRGATDGPLAAIVARALAKSPADRWPDMRTFGRELAAWSLAHDLDTDATGASITIHWGLAGRVSRAPGSTSLPAPSSTNALSTAVTTAPRTTRRSALVPAFVSVVIVVAAIAFAIQWPNHRAAVADRERMESAAAALPSTGAATTAPTPTPPRATVDERGGAPAPEDATDPPTPGSPSAAAAVEHAAHGKTPAACVASAFPEGSFADDTSFLGLCSERDPRRGGALVRSEVARQGLLRGHTTEAMRIWAVLSWYEMASFVVLQGACCPASQLRPVELPEAIGTCEALGPKLDALGAATRAARGVDDAVAALRSTVMCLARGQRGSAARTGPFRDYVGPPTSGADAALLKVLEGVKSRR